MKNATSLEVDLVLSVLCVITPRGHTWSQGELAELCNCSRQLISSTEVSGKKKLRRQISIRRPDLLQFLENECSTADAETIHKLIGN